jgi:hypothetical protein
VNIWRCITLQEMGTAYHTRVTLGCKRKWSVTYVFKYSHNTSDFQDLPMKRCVGRVYYTWQRRCIISSGWKKWREDYLENVGEDGRILQDKTIKYSFLDCYRINENLGILSRTFNIIILRYFPVIFTHFLLRATLLSSRLVCQVKLGLENIVLYLQP